MKYKYSAITGSLNNISDRYMTGGYKHSYTYEEIINGLVKEKILSGVELSFSTEGGVESEASQITPLLAKYGLEPSFVNSSLFGEQKWLYGSLSAADSEVRKQAVKDCKKALDFTREVGACGFNLWTGQDGFDYVFQTDYKKQWDYFTESVKELCTYAPDINITMEPKLREPRNRSLIDTVPTALMVCMEIDKDNLGLTIDVGHTLQAGGNMARDLDIAMKYKRLFNIHINDNYASWDDDMIVGSVHMIEYIEMMYVLQKRGYKGWISVDIFPFRENQFAATRESVLYLEGFNEMVNKIGIEKLDYLIENGSVTDTLKTIREVLFQ